MQPVDKVVTVRVPRQWQPRVGRVPTRWTYELNVSQGAATPKWHKTVFGNDISSGRPLVDVTYVHEIGPT
ncbi:jg27362 [Pararge aegeria aegeria]|uniref:Jg27362 protein n=1 Tax=Pararge aegeria aegeria TaxID=348720 RepID=A0A8S4QT79_9NEOP|nr:jg27362 [Pararge aegeria aegeria]